MAANAYKYGLILRYPNGKAGITGYKYESWHFRYVGKDLAKKLYNGGNWITLEEHFGITSKYDN
jgi:D-alanyl-D-alanine carboxypeptidase